ncbi:MAG: polysaccharide biosynthesis/export family protein [Gemmatales bacterium]
MHTSTVSKIPGMLLLGLGLALFSGCASFSNPTQDSIPVNRLPLEVLGESREIEQTIPDKFLKANKQDPYLLSPNDVLGVFIKGVTGDERQVPPVITFPDSRLPPSIGFPFAIREDGTVSLPMAPEPVKVSGMSLVEAEKEIRRMYVDVWGILKPETASVIVTLQKQHTNTIYVLRQDSGAVSFGGGSLNNTKRGTGIVLDLPYNESDVLTALTKTGGLPGLDARNEVLIFRGIYKPSQDGRAIMPDLKALKGGLTVLTRNREGKPALEVVRIPLRLRPGVKVPFTPEDVRLNDGDGVFIETRETELYYTGGLLPPSELALPRDYDLDVLEAIAQVKGPLLNGGQSGNNNGGVSVTPGLGSPNPTTLTIVRKWPEGKSIIIRVDVAKAFQDPRERILVKPGDFLILQESYSESMTRYITQVFGLNYFSQILNNGTSNISFTGRSP